MQMSGKGETNWELPANASGQREITLHTAGKSKLVRFGPWANCQQTPIILHIAHKCKLLTFGLWKKYWQLLANVSGQQRKSKLVRVGLKKILVKKKYVGNCWQILINQIWNVEKISRHTRGKYPFALR